MPQRPRWADLADTSNETLLDSPKPPPNLTADDSYCSQCAEVDEGSRPGGSLLQRMRQAAALEAPSPPRDFAFLLAGLGASSSSAASAAAAARGADDAEGAWRPNAKALEFVPQGRTSQAAAAPLDFSFLLAPSSLAPAAPVAPAAPRAPASLEPLASVVPAVRRRIPQKRCPAGAGSGKRARVNSGSEVAAAPFAAPPAALAAATDAAEGGGAVEGGGTSALPKASEEDWERRLAKRRGAVTTTKETPEYLEFAEMRARGDVAASTEGLPTPRTPEPGSRSVSKRRWEEEVRKWRAALRLWCPGHGQEASPSAEP